MVRRERLVLKVSRVQRVHKAHAVVLVDKERLVRLVIVELREPRDGLVVPDTLDGPVPLVPPEIREYPAHKAGPALQVSILLYLHRIRTKHIEFIVYYTIRNFNKVMYILIIFGVNYPVYTLS